MINLINKKCIILVIASRGEFYDQFINILWKKLIDIIEEKYSRLFKIYLIFGKTSINKLHINKKNILKFNIRETLKPGILDKTLQAFEYVNNKYNYKYIYRTNLSSFLNIELFNNMLDTITDDFTYLGRLNENRKIRRHKINKYISYISGSCILLSKSACNYILKNKHKLDRKKLPDDVAIGEIMPSKISKPYYQIETYNTKLFSNELLNKMLKEIDIGKYYYIRIKNIKNRNIDVQLIKKFLSYFYNIT